MCSFIDLRKFISHTTVLSVTLILPDFHFYFLFGATHLFEEMNIFVATPTLFSSVKTGKEEKLVLSFSFPLCMCL